MFFLVLLLLFLEPPERKQLDGTDAARAPLPIETLQSRLGTDAEFSSDIAALGAQKLAKRIYLLDAQQQFTGLLAWWHDGQQERLSYFAGLDENWTDSSIALLRALMHNKIHVMNFEGDGDIGQRLTDFAQPSDSLPAGWTLLLRN